jgi:hypothetical protein
MNEKGKEMEGGGGCKGEGNKVVTKKERRGDNKGS